MTFKARSTLVDRINKESMYYTNLNHKAIKYLLGKPYHSTVDHFYLVKVKVF